MQETSLALKVNPEYEALLPKLNPEQYEALKKSILEEGQHYLIAYNTDGEILDGHTRFKICKELGIEPKIEKEPRVFADKLDEKQFVLETNLLRRNLPDFLRIIAAKPLLLIYREKAERRHEEQRNSETGKYEPLPKILGSGEAVEEFAKSIHSNPETVRQALYIEKHATPERIEAVKNGDKTISRAYNETRQELQPKIETPPLPDGKYQTIVIDPPWDTKMVLKEVRPNQVEWPYPVMTLDEIKALPIKELAFEDGCHVYLWVTHKYLPDAFKIFEEWGVKYQCLLTWVKPVGVSPFSWMYNTEHVLFGRIGNLDLLKMGLKLSFEATVEEHSKKPEIFYQRVRDASPEPRLDMFARQSHFGFKSWGNEAEKEVQNVFA